MDRLAFNAVAAISSQQLARQSAVNDLANLSTPGFKRSFESATRAVMADGAGLKTRTQPQAFFQDIISMKPGTPMSTGNDFDISMNDQTVLGVVAPDGTAAFTRRGDLRLNNAGALENGARHLIRAEGGGSITIPRGLVITIRPDGTVSGRNPALGPNSADVIVGKLLLRDASKTPLGRTEQGLYQVDGKPPGTDITNGTIRTSVTAKMLEGSNVNALEAMIKLIDQSRSFEQQINMIKSSKSTDEAGTGMIKPS